MCKFVLRREASQVLDLILILSSLQGPNLLTFMSVTTCWKRPPRAEHSLSMADRSTVVTVRAMAAAAAAASAAAESSLKSANARGTCSHGH